MILNSCRFVCAFGGERENLIRIIFTHYRLLVKLLGCPYYFVSPYLQCLEFSIISSKLNDELRNKEDRIIECWWGKEKYCDNVETMHQVVSLSPSDFWSIYHDVSDVMLICLLYSHSLSCLSYHIISTQRDSLEINKVDLHWQERPAFPNYNKLVLQHKNDQSSNLN